MSVNAIDNSEAILKLVEIYDSYEILYWVTNRTTLLHDYVEYM